MFTIGQRVRIHPSLIYGGQTFLITRAPECAGKQRWYLWEEADAQYLEDELELVRPYEWMIQSLYKVEREAGAWIVSLLAPTACTPEIHIYPTHSTSLINIAQELGETAGRVRPRSFDAEVERRRVHTQEMLQILGEERADRWVYASERPMTGVLLGIESQIVSSDTKAPDGWPIYCYLFSQVPLDPSIIDQHELMFISRPDPLLSPEEKE